MINIGGLEMGGRKTIDAAIQRVRARLTELSSLELPSWDEFYSKTRAQLGSDRDCEELYGLLRDRHEEALNFARYSLTTLENLTKKSALGLTIISDPHSGGKGICLRKMEKTTGEVRLHYEGTLSRPAESLAKYLRDIREADNQMIGSVAGQAA